MLNNSILILLFFVISFGSCTLDFDAILKSINKARTQPGSFATLMESKFTEFQRFKWIIGERTWLTSEGITAVLETIAYLQSMTSVEELTHEKGLDVSAQVQANYLLNQKSLPDDPYVGCRNQNVGERVSYVGTWSKISETMIGGITDPDEIVVRWLVGDGDSSKQTRINLLDPNMKQIGFGSNDVKDIDDLLVIQMAKGFSCDVICPKVPDQKPFNCDGYGFEYNFGGNLPISILIILIANLFIWMLV